jgi:hypothetical protein
MERSMRTSRFLVAVVTLAAMAACGGSNDNGGVTNPNPSSKGTITAKIDGASWSALSVGTSTVGGGTGALIIAGTNLAQTLSVVVPINAGTGLKQMSQSSPVSSTLMVGSQNWAASPAQGGTGSVTITTLDAGHVVGTFTFGLVANGQGVTPATRQVTSGAFDVRY